MGGAGSFVTSSPSRSARCTEPTGGQRTEDTAPRTPHQGHRADRARRHALEPKRCTTITTLYPTTPRPRAQMRPPSNPTGRIVGRSEIGLPTKVWVPPTPVGQVRSGAATGQQPETMECSVLGSRRLPRSSPRSGCWWTPPTRRGPAGEGHRGCGRRGRGCGAGPSAGVDAAALGRSIQTPGARGPRSAPGDEQHAQVLRWVGAARGGPQRCRPAFRAAGG